MPGQRHWPTSQLDKPLPLLLEICQEYLQKNKRKPEFDEGRDGKKKNKNFVERDFKQNKCGNCGELGHYKKTLLGTLLKRKIFIRYSFEKKNFITYSF